MGQCRSYGTTVIHAGTCTNHNFIDFATQTVPTTLTATFRSTAFTATVSSAVHVVDYIEIRWQSSDRLSTITSATSTIATTTAAPAATSSAVVPTPTLSPSSPATPRPQPSNDSKIAIGMAVPLAILAVCAGLFLFWRRRQGKRDEARDCHQASQGQVHVRTMQKSDYLEGDCAVGQQPGYYELDEQRSPRELDSKVYSPHERHELAGSNV